MTSVDLLVMPHGFTEGLSHRDLYTDDWVCLVSADNAEVGEHLTVEHLRTLPWVVCYHGPTASTPAARQMRMLGIEPRVQVVTENFLTVPGLVAGTPRIALLQQRLAARIPAELGLRVLPCPFEVGPLVEAIWWHPMYDDDPEHRYLRDLLVDLAARLPVRLRLIHPAARNCSPGPMPSSTSVEGFPAHEGTPSAGGDSHDPRGAAHGLHAADMRACDQLSDLN